MSSDPIQDNLQNFLINTSLQRVNGKTPEERAAAEIALEKFKELQQESRDLLARLDREARERGELR